MQTLNRPDRMNASTPKLKARYLDLVAEGEADPQVRVFVLAGAGRAFCAGADLDQLKGLWSGRARVEASAGFREEVASFAERRPPRFEPVPPTTTIS